MVSSGLKLFSERKGLTKPREEIQMDYVDIELRNRLWNVLDYYYWKDRMRYAEEIDGDDRTYFTRLWHHYFKRTVDTLSFQWHSDLLTVREYFFRCEWYEVYNFLDFTPNYYPNEHVNEKFMKTCNAVLEEELSAYRFVGGQITEITSEEEISEIEEALETPLTPVKAHLQEALKLMSDKKSPDHRNSIKESISAVEAICRLITKNKKVTLGQCLREMEGAKVVLHGALKKAFSNLYGYTSSAEGIRHALMDEPKLSFEDAKFMLVSCSAFINYLVSKAGKAGIRLG